MIALPDPTYAPDGRQLIPETLEMLGGGWKRLVPIVVALHDMGCTVVDYDNGRWGWRPNPGGWSAGVVGGITDELWAGLRERFVLPGNVTRAGLHIEGEPYVEIRGVR